MCYVTFWDIQLTNRETFIFDWAGDIDFYRLVQRSDLFILVLDLLVLTCSWIGTCPSQHGACESWLLACWSWLGTYLTRFGTWLGTCRSLLWSGVDLSGLCDFYFLLTSESWLWDGLALCCRMLILSRDMTLDLLVLTWYRQAEKKTCMWTLLGFESDLSYDLN